MKNTFNLVSREALLLECSNFFPELLLWAMWYYGCQPFLFHALGILTSETGVQQGDPLGLLFFCLSAAQHHQLMLTMTDLTYCIRHGTLMMGF